MAMTPNDHREVTVVVAKIISENQVVLLLVLITQKTRLLCGCNDLHSKSSGKNFYRTSGVMIITSTTYCTFTGQSALVEIHFYGQEMLVMNMCLSAEGIHCLILTGKNFRG